MGRFLPWGGPEDEVDEVEDVVEEVDDDVVVPDAGENSSPSLLSSSLACAASGEVGDWLMTDFSTPMPSLRRSRCRRVIPFLSSDLVYLSPF